MTTLSLPIALQGPMMTFCSASHEREKPSETLPTKSTVMGLIAAALGRSRSDDLSDLRRLRLAVRVDAPGVMNTHYQTASEVMRANRTVNPNRQVMHRGYLCGAAFMCAVQGEGELIRQIEQALQNPKWPLYLGTRVCLPTRPPYVQPASEHSLDELLSSLPLLQGTESEVLCLIEDERGELTVRDDVPLQGFDTPQGKHRYRRRLRIRRVRVSDQGPQPTSPNVENT